MVTQAYFKTTMLTDLSTDMSKITNFKLDVPKKDANKNIIPNSLDGVSVKVPKDMTAYMSNVGFNRLMSGNNDRGASLSSDVDFKLVFDDISFKTEIKRLNPKLTEPQLQQVADKAQEQMIKTLKAAKNDVFEGKMNLTLEVADFTVKTLSKLEAEAGTDKTEQNFLATVMYNSILWVVIQKLTKSLWQLLIKILVQFQITGKVIFLFHKVMRLHLNLIRILL